MTIRRTPPDGLPAWVRPDPSAEPAAVAEGGLDVEVVEEAAYGWTRVRFDNGWEAWVDGGKLVDPMAPTPMADTAPQGRRRGLLVAVVALVVVAGGAGAYALLGSGDDTPAPSQAADGGPSGGADSSGTEPGDTSGSAAAEGAVAGSYDSIEHVPVDIPPEIADDRLRAPADTAAAESFTSALQQAGVDLTGVEVWVFPVSGTGESLLVFEVDDRAQAAAGSAEDDGGETLRRLLLSDPGLQAANVTRLVMNYHGTDDQGPFTMSFTLPISAIAEAGGDITEDVLTQVTRP